MERPVLLASNTLHLRAFGDPNSRATKCGQPTKGAWEGEPDAEHHTDRLCKRCFKDAA